MAMQPRRDPLSRSRAVLAVLMAAHLGVVAVGCRSERGAYPDPQHGAPVAERMRASFERLASAAQRDSAKDFAAAQDREGRHSLAYALAKRAAYTTDAGRQKFGHAVVGVWVASLLLSVFGEDFLYLDSPSAESLVVRDAAAPRDGMLSLSEVRAAEEERQATSRAAFAAARAWECRLEKILGEESPRESPQLAELLSVSSSATAWAAGVEEIRAALFSCPSGKAIVVFTDYASNDRMPVLAHRLLSSEAWGQAEQELLRQAPRTATVPRPGR